MEEVQKIRQCFHIMQSQDQIMIKQADEYLRSAEQSPDFYKLLLHLFEQDPDQMVRFQALLLFKTLLDRHWTDSRHTKNSLFSNETRKGTFFQQEIQLLVLGYIQNIHDPKFRKSVDQLVIPIVKTDYPQNYLPLYQFFLQSWQRLETIQYQSLNQNEQLQIINIFRAMKKTLKENQKRRVNKSFPSYQNYNLPLLKQIFKIWEPNNAFLIQNKDNIEQLTDYIKFLSKVDQLFTITLMTCYHEAYREYFFFSSEFFCYCIEQLFQKSSFLVQLIQSQKNSHVRELIEKNLKVILYNLGNLQESYPLAFINILEQYVGFHHQMLEHRKVIKSAPILKCTLLALIKVLRASDFQYHLGTHLRTPMDDNMKNKMQLQQNCIAVFTNAYPQGKVDLFLQTLIFQLLPEYTGQVDYNEEACIEQEDDLNEELHELDNSVYNLILFTVEKLIVRFGYDIANFVSVLQGVMTNLDNIQSEVQDSIFAVVGIFPRKMNQEESLKEHINIVEILKAMINRLTKDQIYVRRIPYLTRKWINILDAQTLQQISNIILQVINQNIDLKTKYEYCMCMYKIVSNPHVQVDCGAILQIICPVVVSLFNQVFTPEILWPLLQLLTKLISQTQHDRSQLLIQQFQTPSFLQLLKSESQLVRDALADMFKILVLSFQDKTQITSIYQLILQYIDNTLKGQHTEQTVFSLWYFMAQQHFGHPGLDPLYLGLITAHFPLLMQLNDDDHIKAAIYILEEYVLIGFIGQQQVGQVFQLIEEKYALAHSFGKCQESILIKEACLNLAATLLLINLNAVADQSQQQSLFQMFYKIIVFIIQDLYDMEVNKGDKDQISFKNQLMTITNRFLVLNPVLYGKILENNQINPQDFYQIWIQNMSFLSSKVACKINALALLQNLPMLSLQVFQQHFLDIMQHLYPQLHMFGQQIKPMKKTTTMDKLMVPDVKIKEFKVSKRKEQLRATQLYEDLDILALFRQKFHEYFQTHHLQTDIFAQSGLEHYQVQDLLHLFNNQN